MRDENETLLESPVKTSKTSDENETQLESPVKTSKETSHGNEVLLESPVKTSKTQEMVMNSATSCAENETENDE